MSNCIPEVLSWLFWYKILALCCALRSYQISKNYGKINQLPLALLPYFCNFSSYGGPCVIFSVNMLATVSPNRAVTVYLCTCISRSCAASSLQSWLRKGLGGILLIFTHFHCVTGKTLAHWFSFIVTRLFRSVLPGCNCVSARTMSDFLFTRRLSCPHN